MLHNLRDNYIQNEILEYLIYPLPYLNKITKKEIETVSRRKINSLLYKKYKIKNTMMWSIYAYDGDGYQVFDYNVFDYNKNNMFIAFI